MKCLFINTAISDASVAFIESDQLISIANEKSSKDLSSKIFFMIDTVLENAHCTPQNLDKIFVVTGPGSFTGIRIGLTIAKTMAWALKIALVPISTLEFLATTSLTNSANIISLIDARRGYVYAGGYDQDLNLIMNDQYISIDQLLSKYSSSSNIEFVSYDDFSTFDSKHPSPDYRKIIKKHENDIVENCHTINPVYLKLTEAEANKIDHEHSNC